MEKNLLVIVDMVNGFVNFGALADSKINKITPNIVNLIKKATKNNWHIVAFRDCHGKNDEEFKTFPPHCINGSAESELIPELKPFAKGMLDIPKTTTNGFKTKTFTRIVKNIEYDNVYVVGCCTDICVKDFVTSYLAFNKANNKKTKIHVIENACYTFDGQGHSAPLEHQKAIELMKRLGANIIMCKDSSIQK